MAETLEARIAHIEDRIAISELRARYSFLVDQSMAEEAADLFTGDGEFHGPVKSYVGRAEHVEHYSRQALSGMWHFGANEIIEIDGDRATGQAYCHMPCVFEGESYVCACRYDDVFAREQGVWKFAKRTVSFFYFVPLKDGWGGERMRFPGVAA
ncbi:nuclear transport factor 2 family protein [Sphingomonas sp. MG17]|uniref:Nuclear transport factor 2 family protein n=1 Tax=Sphingomonas tagetis TaxID=2949092 RepID=A0A9X2KNU4_9SPHN|nr:nuclear transport factor 2 family protein [Sphingomonas tagetis]MCP3729988.1 nuclear transport factor 2 family protein [Sphingomonas tagetis]